MAEADPKKQRAFAREVVERLRAGGFEAYWAGGCVRDQLLGRISKDYDVATSARPEEIRAVFGARRTHAVGAAFGVITVLGPPGAGHIEVATFREDAAYSDGRRPDAVSFSTPQADAKRRDFTINGLFYDPLEDRVIDFVGGQEDLARGLVRAIGDPQERFAEDKLRLLRAARFTAALGFGLDEATRRSLVAMASQITVVSAERIAAEMRHMLVHPSRAAAVRLLAEVGLLRVILPELDAADDKEQAWAVTLDALARLDSPTFSLALATTVHAFVDPKGVEALARRWKLSTHELRRTRWLVEHQLALCDARRAGWPRLQRLLVTPGIRELLALHTALVPSQGRSSDDVDYCRDRLGLPAAELNPPPLLTGDDLIAHGVARGKDYQRLLGAARDAQLEKRIATKAEALALVDRLLPTARDANPSQQRDVSKD